MNPLIPILAAAAAFIALRRPARKHSTSSTPPEGTPAPEGTSPPDKPKPKPAKDSVYTGGGFKSPGGGDPPPPGGGGIVFEPPGSSDPKPDPHPDPKPPMDLPSGHSAGKQLVLPESIQWENQLATVNEPIEVQLSDQIDGAKLPDGTYYVRLSLTMELALPPIVHHGSDVYSWNTSIGTLVNYGQREVVTYKISVNGASGILQRVKSSQKKVGLGLSKFIFGCKTKEECGWNGNYNSYFEPILVWNNGLEAQFKTRALSLKEGINRYGATISVTFSRDP